jgi:hypothetical protein
MASNRQLGLSLDDVDKNNLKSAPPSIKESGAYMFLIPELEPFRIAGNFFRQFCN